MYYLQSRYYDPALGRFINADSFASTGDGILSFNLFSYCLNNPVMNVDPNGKWSWSAFTDLLCTGASAVASIAVGVGVFCVTGSPTAAVKASTELFGAINNLTNQIYYNNFSKPNSSLETDPNASSYTKGYVSRWDRLDYTRQQVQSEKYDEDARAFFGEYSFHMYAWYATGWASGKNVPVFSNVAESAIKADVSPHQPDPRWHIRLLSKIWEATGL